MNLACLFGVSFEFSRDAVIKTHAHGNEQVALLCLFVGGQIAVHTEHSHVEGMV